MRIRAIIFGLVLLPISVFANGLMPDSVAKKVMPDTSYHPNGIKRQYIINAGIAWSSNVTTIMSYIHGANPNAGFGAEGPNSFKVMPNFCLGADYGISYRTTVGLALSYQQITGSYDSLGTTEKFSRFNMSVRLLYHFRKNSTRKDLYFGIRWGLSVWSDNLPPLSGAVSYPFPYVSYFSPTSPVEPSLQILFGWRRYFTYGFGINIDAGIGSPYFLMGGISLRFGNHQSTAK